MPAPDHTGPDRGAPDDVDEPEGRDPGLARERTSLAWTRTAIAFAALGGAVLKTHLVPGLVIMGSPRSSGTSAARPTASVTRSSW